MQVGLLKRSNVDSLLVFMLFMPIPIALSRTGIQFLEISIALAGTVVFGVNYNKKILIFVIATTALFISVTSVHLAIAINDNEFSLYQLVRQTYSLICGLIVMCWGKNSNSFFSSLDESLPIYIKLIFGQVVLFYFFPGIVNSAMDYTSSDANLDRLYLHPLTLIVLTSPLIIRRDLVAGVLGLSISWLTQSKQIFVYLLFALSIRMRVSFKTIFISIFLAVISLYIFYSFGIEGRFRSAFAGGEFIRSIEIQAATDAIGSNFNWLFGIGWGFSYWNGLGAYYLLIDDSYAYIINGKFDVHNGFLTLFLRMGIVGGGFILFAHFRWIYLKLSFPMFLMILAFVTTSMLSAASAFQGDYIYLVIICRYLYWKENTGI
jgi:hypothetical protein